MEESIVFLDRDGTINIDHGYVTSPSRVELLPGVADAIANIKKSGFKVVVITNQSAVGRGMASVEDVLATNDEVQKQLLAHNPGALIDQILFSTTTPADNEDTRKPKTGLIKNLKYNALTSWVIGDKDIDVQFGINAGLPEENCILVLTGEGEKNKNRLPAKARIAKDLLEACSFIINQ